ncbi:hypothetical protein ACJX0J_006971, partial [Zea mays]
PDQAVNYVAQERYSFFIINALIFHHSLTAMIKPSEGFASDASSPYSDCEEYVFFSIAQLHLDGQVDAPLHFLGHVCMSIVAVSFIFFPCFY